MVHKIVKERSAKDLPTTYKEVAPLLEDIKDPERQARKTLEQLLKLNLITGNLEVRNKVETKWYWINNLVQELQDTKDLNISIGLTVDLT